MDTGDRHGEECSLNSHTRKQSFHEKDIPQGYLKGGVYRGVTHSGISSFQSQSFIVCLPEFLSRLLSYPPKGISKLDNIPFTWYINPRIRKTNLREEPQTLCWSSGLASCKDNEAWSEMPLSSIVMSQTLDRTGHPGVDQINSRKGLVGNRMASKCMEGKMAPPPNIRKIRSLHPWR